MKPFQRTATVMQMKLNRDVLPEYAKKFPLAPLFNFEASGNDDRASLIFQVNTVGHFPRLYFIWYKYPACCAMDQINHFHYKGFNEEQIHWLMDQFVSLFTEYPRSPRWVFNFVENYFDEANEDFDDHEDDCPIWTDDCENHTTNLSYMNFPHLYTWATRYPEKRKIRSLIMVNQNTGRYIHHVEVMHVEAFKNQFGD